MIERCVSETTPYLRVDSPISFTVVVCFVVFSLISWYIIVKLFNR